MNQSRHIKDSNELGEPIPPYVCVLGWAYGLDKCIEVGSNDLRVFVELWDSRFVPRSTCEGAGKQAVLILNIAEDLTQDLGGQGGR